MAKIDLVLGPAYSIYLGRPSIERLANRARNLRLFSALHDAQIDAIPGVGFADKVEARFAGDWINRLALSSIFVDLQGADTKTAWQSVIESIPALLTACSCLETLVVNGVAEPNRVRELVRLVGSTPMVLTNANAFQLARSRHDYFPVEKRLVKRRSSSTPEHIFSNLFGFYVRTAGGSDDAYVNPCVQPRIL